MSTNRPAPSVRIERVISAPPSAVYRAWLEPEMLARWMAPGSLKVSRVEVDERVGGHFRIWQSRDGIEGGGFECQFLELTPGARIVFRWGFVGPQRLSGPKFDSILTITLQPAPGDATLLTLLHERLDDPHQALPDVARNVEVGWGLVLDKLTPLLNAAAP